MRECECTMNNFPSFFLIGVQVLIKSLALTFTFTIALALAFVLVLVLTLALLPSSLPHPHPHPHHRPHPHPSSSSFTLTFFFFQPYIYTSYLPGKELSFERSFKLSEFDKTRDEILKKVREVPKKHADNIVTELKRHTEHLLLHARIISAVRNEMWWWRLWTVFGMFLVVMLSVGLLAYLYLLHKPRDHYELGLMVSMPIIVTLFCVFLYPLLRRAQHSSLITVEHLRKTFETIYATELLSAECDVYERSWSATNAMILNVINKFGLLSFPSISKREILSLEQVRDKHVQEMLDEIHRNISKLT
eukprot:TRINITY_DN2365_c0_g2_i11.p1 TRINITY_DN2365_c0_g2~~TRINITY_DN2365_c0_g2_i11.p1  ORF type:complete len:304 (+),score=62.15 TRINITY_DN2365_c0_g2_i11:983-1894(+)